MDQYGTYNGEPVVILEVVRYRVQSLIDGRAFDVKASDIRLDGE